MHQLLRKIFKGRLSGDKIFSRLDPNSQELISKILDSNLTYLSKDKMASLLNTCQEIEAKNIGGMMIEAGCALGGSTILIGKNKNPKRPFFVYDLFGMIPPPTSEDGEDVQKRYQVIARGDAKGINDNQYYGYEKNLYQTVSNNLKKFGLTEQKNQIKLVKGLLQDTLEVKQPVCFAHIDVDWYDPVKTCLARIVPKLTVGGSIILDDYHDWSGCKKATDEYFQNQRDKFEFDDSACSLKITRLKR